MMNYTKSEKESTAYNTFKIRYDLMNDHMARYTRPLNSKVSGDYRIIAERSHNDIGSSEG